MDYKKTAKEELDYLIALTVKTNLDEFLTHMVEAGSILTRLAKVDTAKYGIGLDKEVLSKSVFDLLDVLGNVMFSLQRNKFSGDTFEQDRELVAKGVEKLREQLIEELS